MTCLTETKGMVITMTAIMVMMVTTNGVAMTKVVAVEIMTTNSMRRGVCALGVR